MKFNSKSGNVAPFWESNKMVAETVIMLKKGNEICGHLWRKPTKIIRVTNYNQNVVYELKKDYLIDGNTITLTQDSKIPYLDYEVIIGKKVEGTVRYLAKDLVNTVYYGEGTLLPDHQICVTYQYDMDTIDFVLPHKQLEKLPVLQRKIKNHEKLKLLFYGDSIATGCNTSKIQGIEPFMPTWMELVRDFIVEQYQLEVEYINTSVGGMDSCWAVDNMQENLVKYEADLVVLAYGMNDGVFHSCAKFKQNIQDMIDATRTQKIDTEFVLVASMLPSPYAMVSETVPFLGYQKEYIKPLTEISNEQNGIVIADIGTIHESLLKTKFYADMLVNNINHPNDFLAKVYATVIMTSLQSFNR